MAANSTVHVMAPKISVALESPPRPGWALYSGIQKPKTEHTARHPARQAARPPPVSHSSAEATETPCAMVGGSEQQQRWPRDIGDFSYLIL